MPLPSALTIPPGPNHIVEAGSNKELHCELDQTQDPPEVARWFVARDNSPNNLLPLVPPQANIYPTRSVSILAMTNLQKSDTGRYECLVIRNGREVRREATLVVIQGEFFEVLSTGCLTTENYLYKSDAFVCI